MLCGPAIVNFLCLTSFNNHNNTKKLEILSWMGSRLIAARLHTFLAFLTQCSDHVNALYVHVTRGCDDCWSVVRSVLCMGWYCDRCITDTPHTLWSRFCHLTQLEIKIKTWFIVYPTTAYYTRVWALMRHGDRGHVNVDVRRYDEVYSGGRVGR